MADALRSIFSLQSAAWTGIAILFLFLVRLWKGLPAVFAQWVAWRQVKALEKAADWTRLRDENKRLDDRCKRLEVSEEKCRSELADLQTRLAIVEGYQIGRGEAAQEVTIIESGKRLGKDKS